MDDQSRKDAEGLLARLVANQEQQAKDAAARLKEQPKKKERSERGTVEFLRPEEERFIERYLLTGQAATAAADAGYPDPEKNGRKLLGRRLVKERIARVLASREAEKVTLTRRYLDDEVKKIILEGKPFERLKAIELAAKMGGHMAPRRSITEHRKSVDVSPYVELAETLRSSGTAWTREQKDAMCSQLLSDRAAIDEVLALIEKTPASVN